jgi:hypothetical protein
MVKKWLHKMLRELLKLKGCVKIWVLNDGAPGCVSDMFPYRPNHFL